MAIGFVQSRWLERINLVEDHQMSIFLRLFKNQPYVLGEEIFFSFHLSQYEAMFFFYQSTSLIDGHARNIYAKVFENRL